MAKCFSGMPLFKKHFSNSAQFNSIYSYGYFAGLIMRFIVEAVIIGFIVMIIRQTVLITRSQWAQFVNSPFIYKGSLLHRPTRLRNWVKRYIFASLTRVGCGNLRQMYPLLSSALGTPPSLVVGQRHCLASLNTAKPTRKTRTYVVT